MVEHTVRCRMAPSWGEVLEFAERALGRLMEIQVFKFRVYDIQQDRFAEIQRRSTRERISRVRGEIIEGTDEMIDESRVDAEGREILPTDAK